MLKVQEVRETATSLLPPMCMMNASYMLQD